MLCVPVMKLSATLTSVGVKKCEDAVYPCTCIMCVGTLCLNDT